MKKSKGILYFLQEISIVVIGVIIAVSIANYKDSNDNKRYIEKTLLAIENEIKLSQADLDTILERHIKLYKLLEQEKTKNTQTLGEFISNSGGFQVASIQNVSLRFFIANKAELIEFQLISQLIDIELKSKLLMDKVKLLSDFSYDNVNDGSAEVKSKFVYLLANVIDGEQTLVESYSSFYEENKTYLQNSK